MRAPRNQMISVKVRAKAKIGDMLYQKRQAAQRQQPAHCYFVPRPTKLADNHCNPSRVIAAGKWL
jgi:hypothetical protein